MKKVIILISCSLLIQATAVYAQPSPESDVMTTGQVVMPDNTTVSGSVKDNIRKKGELVVVNAGKKSKFKAGDITSAQIGAASYITWNYTFYEILWQGTNLTLLRKANEPAGVQYSGADAVVVNSEGRIDDLFIRKKGDASLHLFDKKTAKDVLTSICSSCTPSTEFDKLDTEAAKKLLADCDKCK